MLIQNNYDSEIIEDKNSRPIINNGRNIFVILIVILTVILIIYSLLHKGDNIFWKQQAINTSVRNVSILAQRGKILDRNGNILAIDLIVKNLIVDTRKLPNFDEQRSKFPNLKNKITQSEQDFYLKLKKLANILKMSKSNIFKVFDYKNYINTKHGEIYLKRNLGKEVYSKIYKLNIPGLKITSNFKRKYPEKKLFSQIVGISTQDLDYITKKEKIIGLEGIEYAYNDILTGHDGLKVMFKDNQDKFIKDKSTIKNKNSINGTDVILSLDKNIQKIVAKSLAKAVNVNKADSGSAVVLDAKTGEVLAMLSYPNYDPEHFSKYKSSNRKNKAVVDLIEPGSIIKPFIISAALNQDLISLTDAFNVNPYNIGKHTIKDVHNYEILDVTHVIKKSSNVGISHIGLKLSPKNLYDYLNKFGIGIKINSGFPGEANLTLKNWQNWTQLDQAVLSYGYGVQTSLLQLARAYTIFTNQGKLLPVTFLKVDKLVVGDQVISSEVANQVKQMLLSVTQEGGTGVKAAVEGYQVAGKTGTVEKNINNKYQKHNNISLFIGFAPVENPNIIVAISIDNARHNGYFGGKVVAPVFAEIVSDTLKIMGVNPSFD